MEIKELVGLNLRRLRRAKGLSQEELYAASGVSQQFISEIENGSRNPTIETLAILAQALKASVADLVAIPDGVRQRPSRRKKKAVLRIKL
jgi:transcriptional regulator with XRE-family HTH domain